MPTTVSTGEGLKLLDDIYKELYKDVLFGFQPMNYESWKKNAINQILEPISNISLEEKQLDIEDLVCY